MEGRKDYKKTRAWQVSMDLSVAVYKLTALLPSSEIYGLASQMRRATVSISSNIAEGSGRESSAQWMNYLRMAYGSALELETQVMILKKLPFGSDLPYADTDSSLVEVLKLLNVMTRT
jgi:four helix bundle protein